MARAKQEALTTVTSCIRTFFNLTTTFVYMYLIYQVQRVLVFLSRGIFIEHRLYPHCPLCNGKDRYSDEKVKRPDEKKNRDRK